MKDTVQITEQGGTGRQVSLICSPPSPCDTDDMSEPEIIVEVTFSCGDVFWMSNVASLNVLPMSTFAIIP